MVAIEIPVDPTVPSNIREPVCGRRSPLRSASSITRHCEHEEMVRSNERVEPTPQSHAVFDASTRIQKLEYQTWHEFLFPGLDLAGEPLLFPESRRLKHRSTS